MGGALALEAAVVAIVLLGGGHRLQAQEVGGVVVDSVSRTPIVGAVVTGLDNSDGVVMRTLTDLRGVFHMADERSRIVKLRVARLGYLPRDVTLEELTSHAVVLSAFPVGLSAVHSIARVECPRGDDQGRAAQLWDQARGALAAIVAGRSSDAALMRIVRYRRQVEGEGAGARIVAQSLETVDGEGTRAFGSGRSPEFLARNGYLAGSGSSVELYIPDEEALLDSSFIETHCFHIADGGRTHPADVGVSFAPVPSRAGLTELEGVLWIDTTLQALDTLRFSFAGPGVAGVDVAAARGEFVFSTTANGVPFRSSWWLKEPPQQDVVLFRHTTPEGYGKGLGQVIRLAVEEGAQVAWAQWPDGSRYASVMPAIAGRVIDPNTGRGRYGVPIVLLNASRRTITDSSGRFEFGELMPGPYLLAIPDTMFAMFHDMLGAPDARASGFVPAPELGDRALGVRYRPGQAPTVWLALGSEGSPNIRIEMAPLERAFQTYCDDATRGDDSGRLAVWLVTDDGAAAGALVEWRFPDRPGGQTARADKDGRVIFCRVPRGQPVTVLGARSDRSASQRVVAVAGAPATLVVLRLSQTGGQK
ncbi:MAG: carboxypeptidase-like regulatory domain-containing protein [Gemmatimonadaceae bacterium]|nr:carboxypeptidase-like regulatory domain-containing protein [Gemmatimonadaceae bacterium]